ncbi:TIP41-like protein isoform X4 [Xiphophorus couchianus]|uniref:TIP41-like protein isoform X4 n=1 Tax=Xiphophorus couchianus TaxID=32473 RepID=UPI00101665D1|nr:TIP41-like protein isoform X4 [Xiphophorus couchianus]
MMLHGFKSSKQDFTFGSWKVTAAKNHIMKSKDIERLADELNMPSLPEMLYGDNVLRIQHTDHYGIEFNAIDALKKVNNMEDTVKVACAQEWQESRAESEHAQEVLRPFDWTFTTDYRGTLLGEELQIKRVMPSSFFLLQRFFLRVDGVLIRINDTRVYYEDGKDYMLREFSTRENTITELKFLKSEADLEYIERRLKLDFINGASESGSFAKENVTGILENLKSIKAKHSLLRCQVSQITDAQKGSMELIRNRLGTAMELIKHCQQTSHLEVESLAESEQGSAMFLDSTISSITAELKS